MIARVLLGAVLFIVAASASAAPTVHEFKLDNGLKVLVREDHRAPVVVSQIWYKVGSSYEPSGLTGMSHALEHMMFKGTPTVGSGEFSRLVAAVGGDENAFTSRDYTAYFQKLEKSRLEVSFRLEADRMRHLLLADDEFAKEIQVIAEERRLRTDDSPEGLVNEHLLAAAFVTSPYRQPIIGWMQDIEALTVADLRRWYAQWYVPNNATLIVVGDVDAARVLELAKTHFGSLPAGQPPAPPPALEIAQLGERRIVVKAPAELPYLVLGYKAPSLKTAQQPWEPYALEVLSAILGGGNSARLSRNLVRGNALAASAGADYSLTARLDDLFVVAANPASGRDSGELERALREQIRALRDEPVSAEELSRVVAQTVAADVYQRDSLFYQAMRMGILETVGLRWNALEDYVDRVKAVTPAQIQDVARRYLTDDRLTVARLEPLPLDKAKPAPPPDMKGDIVR